MSYSKKDILNEAVKFISEGAYIEGPGVGLSTEAIEFIYKKWDKSAERLSQHRACVVDRLRPAVRQRLNVIGSAYSGTEVITLEDVKRGYQLMVSLFGETDLCSNG